MRNYWLRILVQALAIFAVGLAIITLGRHLKFKVTHTLASSDPIPIPLIGLVPFRVDTARLGSIRRVEFLRATPEQIDGIRIVVKMDDSASEAEFPSCPLSVEDPEHLNERTAFLCLGDSTVLTGLERFGEVALDGTDRSASLFLPARTVRDLRATRIRIGREGVHVAQEGDSARAQLREEVAALQDSVDALKERAEELEDSATGLARRDRKRVQRLADSVRALMRVTIDRQKRLEGQLMHRTAAGAGLSAAQLDSLSQLGELIADSVRRAVRIELERSGTIPPPPPAAPDAPPAP